MKKYEIVMEDIKNKILKRQLFPGSKLKTEIELMEEYSVSSTTVIKALNQLVQDGFIIRKQGIGSFVNKSMKEKNVQISESNRIEDGVIEEVKLLDIKKSTQTAINSIVQSDLKEDVFVVERLKYAGNNKISVQRNYISETYFEKFDFVTTTNGISVSENFKQKFGIDTFNIQFTETLTIIDQAEEHIYHQLNLPKGTPLVHFSRTNFLENGAVTEHIETFLNYKHYELTVQSNPLSKGVISNEH